MTDEDKDRPEFEGQMIFKGDYNEKESDRDRLILPELDAILLD